MLNPFFIFFYIAVLAIMLSIYELKNKNRLQERLSKVQNKPAAKEVTTWKDILGIKAGSGFKENDLFIVAFAVGFIVLILVFLLISNIIIAAVFALIMFILSPRIYIKYRINKTKQEFNNQISNGINSLTAALRGGSTIYQGFKGAIDEMPSPIDMIFTQICEDIENGMSVDEAMQNMAEEINTPEAHLFADSITLIKEIGGGTSAINLLESVGNNAKEKGYIKEKIKSATSHVVLAFAISSIIPFLLAGFMSFMLPEFAAVFKTLQGKILILIAVLFIGAGWYLVRNIITNTANSI